MRKGKHNSLVISNNNEDRIERGRSYIYTIVQEIASGDILKLLIEPTDGFDHVHLLLSIGGTGKARVRYYKNPTITDKGTESLKAPTNLIERSIYPVLFYYDVTTSDDGEQLSDELLPGGGRNDDVQIGSEGSPFIIDGDSKILIAIENFDNNAYNFGFRLISSWG